MKRRNFITLLGGAAVWPLVARAQQPAKRPIIGLVSIGASPIDPANFRPFLAQMRELGYVDGQNVTFDRRFAAGDDSLINGFVADLVHRAVDVIVATGTREVSAAKQATSSIPIVTLFHPDPIGMGLAESLARPGGNVTGLTTMDVELYGKRIEILKQAVPTLKRVGVLISPRQPFYKLGSSWAHNLETAAHSLGIALDIVKADESNLDSALAALAVRGAQGLIVTSDGVYVAQGKALAEGAIKYRFPAIFVFRDQVALLSTTFLESLAASGTQLALVRLETVRYRIIVPILHIATVSEHIGSTSPLLLQSAPVACGASVLGEHTRR